MLLRSVVVKNRIMRSGNNDNNNDNNDNTMIIITMIIKMIIIIEVLLKCKGSMLLKYKKDLCYWSGRCCCSVSRVYIVEA